MITDVIPGPCAARMPTRTKLVTEESEKAVYPSVAPSLSFNPPIRAQLALNSHWASRLHHLAGKIYKNRDRSRMEDRRMARGDKSDPTVADTKEDTKIWIVRSKLSLRFRFGEHVREMIASTP